MSIPPISPDDGLDTEDNKKESSEDSRNTIDDIMKCVKPVLFVETLFGIFRFRVTESGFEPVTGRVKVFGVVYSTIIAIVCIASMMEIPEVLSTVTSVVDMVDGLPSIVMLIQYIAAVISTLFVVGNDTIQIFSTLVELDQALKINLNADYYSSSRIKTVSMLSLLVITHIVLAVVDMWTDENFNFGKILLMAIYLEQDLEMFVFCVMVLMLRNRLQIINEYLGKFVYEKDHFKTSIFFVNQNEISKKQFNFIGRISPNNIKIRDLASMYDTIANSCHLLNEVFKFQIFMNLVSTFIFVVLTISASLYFFRYPESSIVMVLATALMWCLLTIISVVIISFSCESLLTVRKNIKLFVNEVIMDYDLPRSMRVQAKIFMELIEAWPLRIYVYDMFSIDIKLMLKFISVATTYLIVIIQVSHSFE